MRAMPIVAGFFHPQIMCCNLCGVAMWVTSGEGQYRFVFRHPEGGEGAPACQNAGLYFDPPSIRMAVVKVKLK